MQWLIDICVERVLQELQANGATLASLHLKGNTTVDLNNTHDIGTLTKYHRYIFANVLRATCFYNLTATDGVIFGDSLFQFVIAGNPLLTFVAPTGKEPWSLEVNPNCLDYDFTINGNTNKHRVYFDAGNERLGIRTSSPSRALDVNGDISLEAGSGNYRSNDGSQGYTGTFTEHTGKTVTVKNGIITNVV